MSAAAPDSHPDRFRADLVLLLACLGWASTFAIVKSALDSASPNAFLAARFTLGTLVAALVARRSLRDLPSLKAGAILGLFLWVGFALGTWGLRYTTATRSGFITSLCVVLVPVLGFLVFRQRVPACAWAGAALAAAGLTVLSAPALTAGGSLLGDGLTVASAVAYAFHLLLISRFAPRVIPSAAVTAQLAVVAVLSALSLPFEDIRFELTPALAGTLVFTGVCASALFLFMQLWAQARTSAVRAALIFSLEPLLAALFARALLADPLQPEVWQGGALILFGILVVELWPRLAIRRRAAASPANPEGLP
ncbi:MAG: DMT family transporter [Deltaproteobacteria bacterium]|nr:DMT family transporter [Deltaproteobacteria bacterium]